MNAIRKHVSGIKGGRLALAAWPARVVALVVSDVPGDDPAQVASGPTLPDPVGLAEARALVAARNLRLPSGRRRLAGDGGGRPDPGDPRFARNEIRVIASAGLSLAASAEAEAAAREGLPAWILSDALEGEAREIGRTHAALIREAAAPGAPFPRPGLLLSGGETTVTLQGPPGRGGRNTEFLLALAAEGFSFTALAADTDGVDGSEENAGAFADGASMPRLRALGADPAALLAAHDAWTAVDRLGDLFAPGPTRTNVNDFRAILIR